jgi:hypothetical protein
MTRIEKLGKLGEDIIAERFGAILSEDKYDREKDLTMPDGTKVEVKTQGRYNKANCFVVDQTPTNNQIRKCVSVDRLIFIEPGKGQKIRIFECTDRNYTVRNIRPGKESYCFDINKMTLVEEFKDTSLWNQIVKLTATDPKWFV